MTQALCQDSGATCMHRHPDVFAQVLELAGTAPRRALSFGCSSGEEPRSLQELAPRWEVHGVELKPGLLELARAADPAGVYAQALGELPEGLYDAVFCMSVLCRYRAPPEDFPFERFEQALLELCARLRVGGVLALYNAQYDLRASAALRERLCAVEAPPIEGGSGFVPKYSPEGQELEEAAAQAVPYLYLRV